MWLALPPERLAEGVDDPAGEEAEAEAEQPTEPLAPPKPPKRPRARKGK
jgi:hypothetical protein